MKELQTAGFFIFMIWVMAELAHYGFSQGILIIITVLVWAGVLFFAIDRLTALIRRGYDATLRARVYLSWLGVLPLSWFARFWIWVSPVMVVEGGPTSLIRAPLRFLENRPVQHPHLPWTESRVNHLGWLALQYDLVLLVGVVGFIVGMWVIFGVEDILWKLLGWPKLEKQKPPVPIGSDTIPEVDWTSIAIYRTIRPESPPESPPEPPLPAPRRKVTHLHQVRARQQSKAPAERGE